VMVMVEREEPNPNRGRWWVDYVYGGGASFPTIGAAVGCEVRSGAFS
jgi:hypothetical protein